MYSCQCVLLNKRTYFNISSKSHPSHLNEWFFFTWCFSEPLYLLNSMPYLFGIFNISDHQNQQVDIHQQVSLVDVHQPSHTWGPTPWAKLRQEYYATPEQGRVIGISASLLLLLWCYWITTLKVRRLRIFGGLIPVLPAKNWLIQDGSFVPHFLEGPMILRVNHFSH